MFFAAPIESYDSTKDKTKPLLANTSSATLDTTDWGNTRAIQVQLQADIDAIQAEQHLHTPLPLPILVHNVTETTRALTAAVKKQTTDSVEYRRGLKRFATDWLALRRARSDDSFTSKRWATRPHTT